ncbi:uncharacterized protein SRS1_25001 [Sporisorium reilianum f. sp. reilianum]|uniref:Uncharacterized protein n=1 Tax=Sporisorium reilianum f. sp. reilianum TaxID=72559 RepID=A0A2N8UIL4_9BASI|nr:uncharacterized protein SRS1_25001 [Sporisorium reilianum f. sp. reilianum]
MTALPRHWARLEPCFHESQRKSWQIRISLDRDPCLPRLDKHIPSPMRRSPASTTSIRSVHTMHCLAALSLLALSMIASAAPAGRQPPDASSRSSYSQAVPHISEPGSSSSPKQSRRERELEPLGRIYHRPGASDAASVSSPRGLPLLNLLPSSVPEPSVSASSSSPSREHSPGLHLSSTERERELEQRARVQGRIRSFAGSLSLSDASNAGSSSSIRVDPGLDLHLGTIEQQRERERQYAIQQQRELRAESERQKKLELALKQQLKIDADRHWQGFGQRWPAEYIAKKRYNADILGIKTLALAAFEL